MARRNDFDDTALTMLFGEPETETDSGIAELNLDDILPFHTGGNHPFEIEEDADMRELEEDMRENGQLEPIIVRKDVNLQGRYETITGHRRTYVARKLGLTKIKATIVDYDDEQAVKLMVVSNLQKRSEIKPSVKAKAYKMYMKANKRQKGRPRKEDEKNVSKLETNFRTDEQAAQEFKESRATIQRYLRLNKLVQPLLDMVDEKDMKVGIGVELSYLDKENQEMLLGYISDGYMPTLEEATEIKRRCKDGGQVSDVIGELQGKGPAEKVDAPQLPKVKKPKLNERFINEYLPEPMRKMDIERKRAYTQAALIMYNNYLLEHPEEQAEWEEEE